MTYLRSLRKKKRFSLRDVERKTGISNAYLSQLETGNIKAPSPAVLVQLADLYGVNRGRMLEEVYEWPQGYLEAT